MQEHLCLNCPARFLARHVETSRGDIARLLEALGESVAAAEIRAAAAAEAVEIRAAGCGWRWTITEDNDTGATRRRDVCGMQALPEFLTAFGARIVEATQTCGSMRNEVAQGLGRIAAAAELTATAAVLRPAAPYPPGGLTLDQFPRPAGELAAALVDAERAPVPLLIQADGEERADG